VRVRRPNLHTLFELCCTALAANESLYHSVTSKKNINLLLHFICLFFDFLTHFLTPPQKNTCAAAPDYAARVPLVIRDYLLGTTAYSGNLPCDGEAEGGAGEGDSRGRTACSRCGKVFYGKAAVDHTYSRHVRTAGYDLRARARVRACAVLTHPTIG
jgi:uncharacterized C2H2 Zn-finger protein